MAVSFHGAFRMIKDIFNNNCRICGEEKYTKVYNKSSFNYVICSKCGVTRQFPYPTEKEIHLFYENYLNRKQKVSPLYLSDNYWEKFKNEKDLTFKDLKIPFYTMKDKKVLDIGCAVGQFVQYMLFHGAECCGIDVSEELVNIAQKNGLNCSTVPLFDIDKGFDLISMWHVIEHVGNPKKYLAHINTILNKSGALIIETPCRGIISSIFGAKWRFYMPIEHIHLFSQNSLFKLLNLMGFRIVRWTRFGSGNTSGTVHPLLKLFFDRISKLLHIGDTIAVYCEKK